jgi:hypothetical protein
MKDNQCALISSSSSSEMKIFENERISSCPPAVLLPNLVRILVLEADLPTVTTHGDSVYILSAMAFGSGW